jgi:hypothetical protein
MKEGVSWEVSLVLGREKQKMKKQIATIKKKMRRRKHKAKRK